MFVVIEGLDASGKSTLMNEVIKELQEQGIKTKRIDRKTILEEKESFVLQKIRLLDNILFGCTTNDNLKEISSKAWIYLNASWFQMVSYTYLNKEDDVIYLSDSWVYKRIARFSLVEEFGDGEVEKIYDCDVKPELIFFLDVPPEETWKRRERHSTKDFGFLINDRKLCTKEAFINYQSKIYKYYKKKAIEYKWIIFDNETTIESKKKKILQCILLKCK